MNKLFLICLLTTILYSCNNINDRESHSIPSHSIRSLLPKVDDSTIKKDKELLQGKWIYEDDSSETLYFDKDWCIGFDGQDTSFYTLSYKSCDEGNLTSDSSKIEYLHIITKQKEQYCYSIANLTKSRLVYIYLNGNGSIIKLHKR